MRNSLNKNNNGVLERLESVVAGASPATTRLFNYENSENDGSVILDATQTIDKSIFLNEEIIATSLTLAEGDALQESKAVAVEAKATAVTPQKQGGAMSSETATTPAQATGGGTLSTLAATPGLSAAVSIGTVALGGLAIARSVLGQRQKKLDEEKRNLEEQQKRFETVVRNQRYFFRNLAKAKWKLTKHSK